MLFVKRLGQLQSASSVQSKTIVRFPLQSRQIIKQWRNLRSRFFLFGNDAGFTATLPSDFCGLLAVPNPLRARVFLSIFLKVLVEPAPAVATGFHFKRGVDFKIWARLESADFFFAPGQNSQGRCLNPACRGHLETAAA